MSDLSPPSGLAPKHAEPGCSRPGDGPPATASRLLFAGPWLGELVQRLPLPWFRARPGYQWWVVGTVCLGAFMGQLDASIATLLLPTLRVTFHEHLADVEWVAISYLLALVSLVVMFGRLADMFGRKALYTLGFIVFTAGSVACGSAGSLETLIIARIVQALGAAMLQANSVAIITQAVDRSELGAAIGVQGAAQAVGLSVGPALGGFLISVLGWQWAFYINLPVGIVGTALAAVILPNSGRAGKSEPFDWLGLALFAPGTAMLMYVLTQGEGRGWGSSEIVSLFLLSVVLVGLFWLRERRARFPMVDLKLFANRLFTASIVAGLLSYAVLFGTLFVIPVFLERALRRSAETTGLTLTAVPFALALVAPLAGQLADRFGSRGLTAGGMAVSAVALLLLDKVPPGQEVPLLGVLALFGLGVGAFTPPNNAAIMGAAPRHRLGVAGGVLNMTRGLGTTLGVVATGAVLAWRQQIYSQRWLPAEGNAVAYRVSGAFHDSVLFLLALAVLAGVISLVRGRTAILKAGPEHPQELL
jgi:EmrB/QacA subfamily drug resistance transporter